MAAGRWFDRRAGIVQLWGLWVEPPTRRLGLGRALVDAVAGWASSRGAGLLRLGVADRAEHAAMFYERPGFVSTGETKALRPDGAVTAFFLAKPLEGRHPGVSVLGHDAAARDTAWTARVGPRGGNS
jgi:ribosomal protein S18 acetylase RimI-like enzyme